jgi:hypothetical protein
LFLCLILGVHSSAGEPTSFLNNNVSPILAWNPKLHAREQLPVLQRGFKESFWVQRAPNAELDTPRQFTANCVNDLLHRIFHMIVYWLMTAKASISMR